MLSSPVYTSRVVHGSFTSTYPHFHRALRQLRDVLCFLLVQVGVVDAAQVRELVQVLTRLARTAGKLRSQRRQGDAGGLDALRSATISLLTTLNDLRLEELSMRGMAGLTIGMMGFLIGGALWRERRRGKKDLPR